MITHDLGRDRGGVSAALASVTARALVIAVDSDRLFPPAQSERIAAGIPGAVAAHHPLRLRPRRLPHRGGPGRRVRAASSWSRRALTVAAAARWAPCPPESSPTPAPPCTPSGTACGPGSSDVVDDDVADEPSVLDGWTVAELVAHLGRAMEALAVCVPLPDGTVPLHASASTSARTSRAPRTSRRPRAKLAVEIAHDPLAEVDARARAAFARLDELGPDDLRGAGPPRPGAAQHDDGVAGARARRARRRPRAVGAARHRTRSTPARCSWWPTRCSRSSSRAAAGASRSPTPARGSVSRPAASRTTSTCSPSRCTRATRPTGCPDLGRMLPDPLTAHQNRGWPGTDSRSDSSSSRSSSSAISSAAASACSVHARACSLSPATAWARASDS